MYSKPTREEAIKVTQELIEGRRDPQEVGLWAAQLDLPENEKIEAELRSEDPDLRDFLDTLSLSAQRRSDGQMLYGSEDFKEWLAEFEGLVQKK